MQISVWRGFGLRVKLNGFVYDMQALFIFVP